MVAYKVWAELRDSSACLEIRSGRGIGRAAAEHIPRQKTAAQMNQAVTMNVISIRDWRYFGRITPTLVSMPFVGAVLPFTVLQQARSFDPHLRVQV